MGVVGKTQDDIGEHGGIGFEHIDVQMVVIIGAGSVIGVALHQHQLGVDLEDGMHGPLDLTDIGGTGGNEEWLAFGSHALESFDPIDLT